MTAISTLRGLTKRRTFEERCELCSQTLGPEHPHLLERPGNRIVCACDPCAILFSHRDADRRMIRVPRDARPLQNFQITDQEWNALRLPIDLAFFVTSEDGSVRAYYPSPGGCTESLLSLESWQDLVASNPVLAKVQPDVEALLVNRTRGHRDYFIAPIDACYKLTGLIRIHWRGFSGGDEVWKEVDQFFAKLAGALHA